MKYAIKILKSELESTQADLIWAEKNDNELTSGYQYKVNSLNRAITVLSKQPPTKGYHDVEKFYQED